MVLVRSEIWLWADEVGSKASLEIGTHENTW